jgi:hypothetical protein
MCGLLLLVFSMLSIFGEEVRKKLAEGQKMFDEAFDAQKASNGREVSACPFCLRHEEINFSDAPLGRSQERALPSRPNAQSTV